MKSDLHKENDEAIRKGNSAVYKADKIAKSVKAQLANCETKQNTLDFIFGKTTENSITR